MGVTKMIGDILRKLCVVVAVAENLLTYFPVEIKAFWGLCNSCLSSDLPGLTLKKKKFPG